MKTWLAGMCLLVLGCVDLVGCSAETKTPCPNYGFWCHKADVNGWDKQRSAA